MNDRRLGTERTLRAGETRVGPQLWHSVPTMAFLVSVCALVALALPAWSSAAAPGYYVDEFPSDGIDRTTPGTVEGSGGTSVGFTRKSCQKAKKNAVKKAKNAVKKAKNKVKKANGKSGKRKAKKQLKKAKKQLKKARGQKCKTLGARLPRAAQEPERRGAPLTLSKLDSGFSRGTAPPVGRFYLNGVPFCSGTLIARGLVLTAAHCIYDNDDSGTKPDTHPNGYYQNSGSMVFVPGNTVGADGSYPYAPYGVWNVDRAVVPNGWTGASGSFTGGLDWGLVTLQPISGKYAGDYTGAYDDFADTRFGIGVRLWSLGYPADGVFDQAKYAFGSWLYFCDNKWEGDHVDALNGDDDPRFNGGYWLKYWPCEMTGGSSGGPVFGQFGDGTWGIIAVNNRGSNPVGGVGYSMGKSWFSRSYAQFYNAAIAVLRAPARARLSSDHDPASAIWSGAAPTDAVSPELPSEGPDSPSLGSANRKPPPPPG